MEVFFFSIIEFFQNFKYSFNETILNPKNRKKLTICFWKEKKLYFLHFNSKNKKKITFFNKK